MPRRLSSSHSASLRAPVCGTFYPVHKASVLSSWIIFIQWWLITAQVSLSKLWLESLAPNSPPALQEAHEVQLLNPNLSPLLFFPLFLSPLPTSNWFLDMCASLPDILNSLWNEEWIKKPTTNVPLPALDDSRRTLVQVDGSLFPVLFVSLTHDNFWMSCRCGPNEMNYWRYEDGLSASIKYS